MAGRGNQYPQCRQKQGSFRGIRYLLCLLPRFPAVSTSARRWAVSGVPVAGLQRWRHPLSPVPRPRPTSIPVDGRPMYHVPRTCSCGMLLSQPPAASQTRDERGTVTEEGRTNDKGPREGGDGPFCIGLRNLTSLLLILRRSFFRFLAAPGSLQLFSLRLSTS